MPYCQQCIDRDFVKIREEASWFYGTKAELQRSIDSGADCNLCKLLWSCAESSYVFEDVPYPHGCFADKYAVKAVPVEGFRIILRRRSDKIAVLAHKPLSEESSQQSIPATCALCTDSFDVDKPKIHLFLAWLTLLDPAPRECLMQCSPPNNIVLKLNRETDQRPDTERLPHPHPGSGQVLNMLDGWIHECVNDHRECRRTEIELRLPTRVIDVFSDNTSTEANAIKLIDTGKDQSIVDLRYIALSYCWGTEPFLTTTSSNVKNHTLSFKVSGCPQVVQDAVFVTRKLGVRYLWIDSLCIIQGSGGEGSDEMAKEDFAIEAPKMRQYYSDAFLTISAGNTTQAQEGFLRPRWGLQRGLVILDQAVYLGRTDSDFQQIHDRLAGPALVRRLIGVADCHAWKSTVNTRGWCLQETLLSHRTLSYCDWGIIFSCHKGWRDETHVLLERHLSTFSGLSSSRTADAAAKLSMNPGLRQIGLRPVSEKDLTMSTGYTWPRSRRAHQAARYYLWAFLIAHYSKREFTRLSDKLIAIEGLVQKWQNIYGGQYFAGIWEDLLPEMLLWQRASSAGAKFSSNTNFPSWCWASHQGHIRFAFFSIIDQMTPSARIERLIEPSGAKSQSDLKITGRLWDRVNQGAQIIFDSENDSTRESMATHDDPGYMYLQIGYSVKGSYDRLNLNWLRAVVCKAYFVACESRWDCAFEHRSPGWLRSWPWGLFYGLVLMPEAPQRSTLNGDKLRTYSRVGCYKLSSDDDMRRDQAFSKMETIILR